MIEIFSSGASNTVQDLGRFGYLDAGVGYSGTMDGLALEVGNAMLGNPRDAAGIEVTVFPFRVKFLAPRLVAVTGADCPVMLGGRSYPGWWVMQAKAGDELRVDLPRSGARAVLAFAGGLDVPEVLGSRATDLKSGWGGHEGRGLNRGDRLQFLPSRSVMSPRLDAGFGVDPTALRKTVTSHGVSRVRILASAEYSAFTDEARKIFLETDWLLTNDANRQGYRFSGPALALRQRLELLSHGIMPGTVQVPPSGQPIIQLAEANTCGGYPKIANVIEADLWRLAQMRPGESIRFVEVTRSEAVEVLKTQRAVMADIARTSALMHG